MCVALACVLAHRYVKFVLRSRLGDWRRSRRRQTGVTSRGDRCLAPTAGAVPGTVCEASCVTRVRLLVHIAGAAVRLAPQSSVGGMPLVGAWHRSVRPEVAGRAGSLTCSEQEPVEREARRYRTPLASAERSTGNRSCAVSELRASGTRAGQEVKTPSRRGPSPTTARSSAGTPSRGCGSAVAARGRTRRPRQRLRQSSSGQRVRCPSAAFLER